VTRRLIEIRDRLALEPADQAGPDWLDNTLVEALVEAGVTPFQDATEVDGIRHFVLNARRTDDPSLDEQIAATIRPGYESANGLVRPQVVVAWVWEEAP